MAQCIQEGTAVIVAEIIDAFLVGVPVELLKLCFRLTRASSRANLLGDLKKARN